MSSRLQGVSVVKDFEWTRQLLLSWRGRHWWEWMFWRQKKEETHSPLDTLWYGNRSQGSRESPSAHSSSGGAAFMLEGEWISMQAGRQWFNVIMSWRNCSWSLSWLATAWPWGCKGLALSQMIESAQHDDYPKLAFIFSSWGLLCFTFSEKIRVLVEGNRLMFCAETGSEQQLVPEQHS